MRGCWPLGAAAEPSRTGASDSCLAVPPDLIIFDPQHGRKSTMLLSL